MVLFPIEEYLGVEAPVNIIPNDSLEDSASYSCNSGSSGLEVMVPKGLTLTRLHSKNPTDYKLWLQPGFFGLHVSSD